MMSSVLFSYESCGSVILKIQLLVDQPLELQKGAKIIEYLPSLPTSFVFILLLLKTIFNTLASPLFIS